MKIIIAPTSHAMPNDKINPKNWPYWNELIRKLKDKGHYLYQIGLEGELLLGCHEDWIDQSFDELKKLLDMCDTFISVDSFFPHFAHYHGRTGTVIFTQSDPKIFGYKDNNNLLKDRKYLRKGQFWLWTQAEYNEDAFISVDSVLNLF